MKVRKAIIPAAGLGTRLLPNTKSIPKEMLPLVDKPVLQYIVEEAVAAGVEEILIITNRGKSPIEDYFDYAPDLEARLLSDGKEKEARTVREVADMADVYFLRQKETKGLGHAIWRAKSFVGDEPFGILLGDAVAVIGFPIISATRRDFEGQHQKFLVAFAIKGGDGNLVAFDLQDFFALRRQIVGDCFHKFGTNALVELFLGKCHFDCLSFSFLRTYYTLSYTKKQ